MLPYIHIDPFKIGPIELQPFGILLATGVLFGSYMGRRFLDRHNMDDDTSRWLIFRLVIWGFVICHFVNALLYEPGRVFQAKLELPFGRGAHAPPPAGPLVLLYVWDGISSYGGIIGALVTYLVFTRNVPQPFNRWRWLDMLTYALVPGFWFGRMGCASVHDHVGVATNFPLAVDPHHVINIYGDGTARALEQFSGHPAHDLGLYEAMFLMPAIWITVLVLARITRRRDGLIAAVAGIMYSIPRFCLDFLRLEKSDPRYFGLTPAQYFSIAMFIGSIFLLRKIYTTSQFTIASEGDAGFMPQAKVPRPNKKGSAESGAGGAKAKGTSKGSGKSRSKSGGKKSA